MSEENKLNSIDVTMRGMDETMSQATITIHEDRLIMLHSANICSQWPINKVGVMLTRQGKGIIKLAFMGLGDAVESYQSFYFIAENYELIDLLFKRYGFPMLVPINEEEMKNDF